MPLEVLLPAAVLILLACIWVMFRAGERRRVLDARLLSLRGERFERPRLRRVPLKALSSPETQIATAGVVLSLVFAFMLNLPVWFLLLQLCLTCPLAWLLVRRYRLQRMRRRFAERFPEAVDSFTRAVQAGVPVEKIIASLGDIYDGEIGERFRRLVHHLELGMPFREALRHFSRDLDLPDVDFFCAVLALNRETGSQLSPMLLSLSQMLRDRRAVDRKLQALTSESRAAARVLCALPFFIIGLQLFLNPRQMDFLLYDPTGRTVLGCCIACMIVGLLIVRRMSRMMEA